MTVRYEDALDAAITAIRRGDALESVLSRTPDHAEALRDDLRLVAAVRNHSRSVAPSDAARADANQRLMATLQSEQTAASGKSRRGSAWRSGLPKLALAAALVAIAFVTFAVVDRSDRPTVEAATLEGVVIESGDGSLTVQTLDALEQVTVPAGAAISDTDGASIALAGIEPGEVVSIQAQRRGDSVVAQQVARVVANIEAWCSDDSERCEVLTDRLRSLERACENDPVACRTTVREINQLRLRAADSARLEALKTRCRSGEQTLCEELATFCREHQTLCAYIAPVIPTPTTEMRERIRQLIQSCQQAEAVACRQLTQICQDHAGVCPNTPTRRPSTSSTDPAPTARPLSDTPARPSPTPSTQRQPSPSTDRSR